MQDGQTTGQRVEVRIAPPKRYTDDSYTQMLPDTVYRGHVVAWDLRGGVALVQTDRGSFMQCYIPTLSILVSQEQRDREATAQQAIAVAEHLKDCGPLCREHGDPRDTNVAEPVAFG